jgi:hypothetical protein
MPTIIIPDKICIQCNLPKYIYDFYALKGPCSKLCIKCYNKNYYQKNKKEASKKASLKYANLSKEEKVKKIQYVITWKKNNPDKLKIYNKRTHIRRYSDSKTRKKCLDNTRDHLKKAKQNLLDYYIKNLINKKREGLSNKDIPQELVELKRKEVLLKRKLKLTNYGKIN